MEYSDGFGYQSSNVTNNTVAPTWDGQLVSGNANLHRFGAGALSDSQTDRQRTSTLPRATTTTSFPQPPDRARFKSGQHQPVYQDFVTRANRDDEQGTRSCAAAARPAAARRRDRPSSPAFLVCCTGDGRHPPAPGLPCAGHDPGPRRPLLYPDPRRPRVSRRLFATTFPGFPSIRPSSVPSPPN